MKACTNLGVFSRSAIAAVTVQTTLEAHVIFALSANATAYHITCVLDDIGEDVVKLSESVRSGREVCSSSFANFHKQNQKIQITCAVANRRVIVVFSFQILTVSKSPCRLFFYQSQNFK